MKARWIIRGAFIALMMFAAFIGAAAALRAKTRTELIAVWSFNRVSYLAFHRGHVEMWFTSLPRETAHHRRFLYDRMTPDLYEADVALQSVGLKRSAQLGWFRAAEGDDGTPAARGVTTIWVPDWILTVPAALIFGSWSRRQCTRGARFQRGNCVDCGYDLQGSAHATHCPECGATTPRRKNHALTAPSKAGAREGVRHPSLSEVVRAI